MFLNKVRRKICLIADAISTGLNPGLSRVESSSDIYFTFDDGPHPKFTPMIIDLLAAKGHTATFFLIGENARKNKALTMEILSSGNTVGSHSSVHLKQWTTNTFDQMNDYRTGHEQVEDILGKEIKLFRPPYGHHDRRSVRFCKEKNLRNILWNCESYDWQQGASREKIFSNVESRLEPGNIVLMHDSIYDNPRCADRSETVAAVKMLIDRLETKGLQSSSLT